MTVVGKNYIVAIYYRHPARQVNGSIYKQTKLSLTTILINALKGKFFPGRGFSSGVYIAEKMGLGKLLGEVS